MKKIAILIFVVSLIAAAFSFNNAFALQTSQAVELLTTDEDPDKENNQNECCKDKKEGECCKEKSEKNQKCSEKSKNSVDKKKIQAEKKNCEQECKDNKDDN